MVDENEGRRMIQERFSELMHESIRKMFPDDIADLAVEEFDRMMREGLPCEKCGRAGADIWPCMSLECPRLAHAWCKVCFSVGGNPFDKGAKA